MITTFFLTKSASIASNENRELAFPKNYQPGADPFSNLFRAISLAISNQDDLILFISDSNWNEDIDLKDLANVINELVPENIFGLIISAEYNKELYVNERLKMISEIKRLNSFVLVRPIFKVVLNFLDAVTEFPDMTFDEFLTKIVPENLIWKRDMVNAQVNYKFHIISPFRNVEPFINEYLHSIFKQDFKNFFVTLIDDNSDDNSLSRIPVHPQIEVLRNTTRKFALENVVSVLLNRRFEDETVVCILDGDDRLSNRYVLSILNSAYQQKDLLFTYGSMKYLYSFGKLGSAYTRNEYDKLRDVPWKITHLRTFKYKLFQALIEYDPKLESLKNDDGSFIKIPADVALYLPLLEIAGFNNIRFIDSILCDYRIHDHNDHAVNRLIQLEGDENIRKRKPFGTLF